LLLISLVHVWQRLAHRIGHRIVRSEHALRFIEFTASLIIVAQTTYTVSFDDNVAFSFFYMIGYAADTACATSICLRLLDKKRWGIVAASHARVEGLSNMSCR
jgi:hypothetical protein